ncbi:putative leucine-rich repeat domain superfamily [Helianthus annuus]|nr:putative leucine-rich repeat domain superfamily [Helianthus annuus]
MESLEVLDIGGLNLKKFPDYIITGHSSSSLLELNLEWNDIEDIPSSIGNLHNLVSLDLEGTTAIMELPEDLGQLECLENLNLIFTKVKHLPGSICMLKHLKALHLSRCVRLEKLPEDVGQLESLEILHLGNCYNLREIPNSICELKCLEVLYLQGCSRLEKLPDKLGNLQCLQFLDIYNTGITHLPQSIYSVKGLKINIYFS